MHLDELEHNNLSFIFIFSVCSFCWHLTFSLFHKLCAPCCINIKPELQSVERFLPPRRFVGCPHSLDDDNNNNIVNNITTWTYSLSLATSHPCPVTIPFSSSDRPCSVELQCNCIIASTFLLFHPSLMMIL